jgi:IS5 family transposase
MMDCASGRILMTATATGRCHDRRLCRESHLRLPAAVYVVADSGYQGLQTAHARTVLPYKAAPRRPLEPEERAINRLHAQLRIRVEHLIRRLKVFWILARPDRNRRRRFGLRLNLIAGLYNFELARR